MMPHRATAASFNDPTSGQSFDTESDELLESCGVSPARRHECCLMNEKRPHRQQDAVRNVDVSCASRVDISHRHVRERGNAASAHKNANEDNMFGPIAHGASKSCGGTSSAIPTTLHSRHASDELMRSAMEAVVNSDYPWVKRKEKGTSSTRSSSDKEKDRDQTIFEKEERKLANVNLTSSDFLLDNLCPDTMTKSLQKLSLFGKKLCIVPQSVVSLSDLEMLQLSQCDLRILPEKWNLPCLKWLDLSRNRLEEFLDETILKGLPELQHLDMYENEVCKIVIPQSEGVLPKIDHINLGNNKLSSLPVDLNRLTSLRTLKVMKNMLETIPMEVCDMDLSVLDVSCNPLIQPPVETCNRGISSMRQYYASLRLEEEENDYCFDLGKDLNMTQSVMTKYDLEETRRKRGECHTCGRKCFQKRPFNKMVPITEHALVLNGRCLKCKPLEPSSDSAKTATLQHLAQTNNSFNHIQRNHSGHGRSQSFGEIADNQLDLMSQPRKRSWSANCLPPTAHEIHAMTTLLSERPCGPNPIMGHVERWAQKRFSFCPGPDPTEREDEDEVEWDSKYDSEDGNISSYPPLRSNTGFTLKAVRNTPCESPISEQLKPKKNLPKASKKVPACALDQTEMMSEKVALQTIQNLDLDYWDILQIMQSHTSSLQIQKESLKKMSNRQLLAQDQQDIADLGGLGIIVNGIKAHRNQSEVLLCGCRAIWNLMSGSTQNQVGFAEAGAIGVMLKAFVRFPGNAEVQEKAMASLSKLSAAEANQSKFVESGGVRNIIDAMSQHLQDARFQQEACVAITNLASRHLSAKRAIIQHRGAETVVECMRMHHNDSNIQEKALGALRNMCADDNESRVSVAGAGGTDAVVSAMKDHTDKPGVQEVGARTLSNLALNVDNRRAIGDNGGIDVIVCAMWYHLDNAAVQESACGALFTLSIDPTNRNIIKQKGGISAVANAMQAHGDDVTVQRDGCGVLSNLAEKDDHNEVQIFEEEAIADALVMAMFLHSDNVLIQERACTVIKELALGHNLKPMQAANLAELVSAAAKKFSHQCGEKARYILTLLDSSRFPNVPPPPKPSTQTQEKSSPNPLNNKISSTKGNLTVIVSDPLVWADQQQGNYCPINSLDFCRERDILSRCITESKRDIEISFDVATVERLQVAVAKRCECLHFSGHGHPSWLLFEDGRGGAHWVTADLLYDCVRVKPFKFVFVSACHSSVMGDALIKAGVPHVLCCEEEKAVRDDATLTFTQTFYRSLFEGYTIQTAFDQSKLTVKSKFGLDEVGKYLLLPSGTDHNQTLFDAPEITPTNDCAAEDTALSIPVQPLHFFGREIDEHALIGDILSHRLVTLHGIEGIGCSSLASVVSNYINHRKTILLEIEHVYFVRGGSPMSALYEYLVPEGEAKQLKGGENPAENIVKGLSDAKALIVFDGADTKDCLFVDFLKTLFEKTKATRVLLTTREPLGFVSSAVVEKSFHLKPLDKESAAKLFSKICPRVDATDRRTEIRKSLNSLLTNISSVEERETREEILVILRVVEGGIPGRIVELAQKVSERDCAELIALGISDESAASESTSYPN